MKCDLFESYFMVNVESVNEDARDVSHFSVIYQITK